MQSPSFILQALISFIVCLNFYSVKAQPIIERTAVHGMLVFGTERVYASHLPMFHSPHHYQILLELELEKAVQSRFNKYQRAHPQVVTFTLAPERFVLPEMMTQPRLFKAVLYDGHFERGGKAITDSVLVKIKNVVYLKKFEKAEPREAHTRYIVFGNEKEQFAAHVITQAPDFDHVVQVIVPSFHAMHILTVDNIQNVLPGVSGNTIQATDPSGRPLPMTWLRQLYLEFSDLQK